MWMRAMRDHPKVSGGSNAPIGCLPTAIKHQRKNPEASADSLMTLITDWLHMWKCKWAKCEVYKSRIQRCSLWWTTFAVLLFVVTESWRRSSEWVSFILVQHFFKPFILNLYYGCNWLFKLVFGCDGLICSLILGLAAKKVLLVYAHQSSSSFNAAAKDAAVEILTAQGCTVEVSDLYAMKFKATATAEDITGTELSHWY